MRIKDGFVLRDVAGQTVVIATGEASRDFHGMVKLNGTGRVIWEGLSRGDDAEDIAQELVKSYDVDLETAQRDVASFVATAQKAGFLAGRRCRPLRRCLSARASMWGLPAASACGP